MKAEIEQFSAKNPNPMLSVAKDGTVLYSNKDGKLLLQEWGVELGEKLPSDIKELVQGVISRNSPEKIEVKAEESLFLVVFSPLPEQNCVNISGFDIVSQKVLEEKLRESEEKYRIVADNTYDWEFWIDPDGRFQYTSPSCERVTGYAAQEFMDKPDLLQEIIHLDDRQTFLQHKRDMSLSSHGDIEFRITTKDGEIKWIHHVCQPVYDNKGCYAGNRGSNRDITERKRAEEIIQRKDFLLHRAQEFLEAVTKGTGVIIATIDTNFCYTYFNKAYQKEMKLLSGKEINIGVSIIETFAHLPEQQKTVIEEWSEVLKGKSSRKTMAFGNPDLYQKTYDVLHTPILDSEGKIIGAGEVAYDVTEKVRLEEVLRESKARIESIFRSSPVGIGVVVNRMIKEANDRLCEMTGYSREELLEKSSLMLYPTVEEYERVGLVKYNMISERGTGYMETRWQRKDGSVVDILLSSSPIVPGDLSGEVTFTALDITERKKYEEALKKANERLEERVEERTSELETAYNSLKESEQNLAEAQELAHIGNWSWDFVTGETCWSEEMYHIFGLNPQKLSPTHDEFLNYIHPDDRDYMDNAIKKAINKKPSGIDYRIITADGKERIVHAESEVIFDPNNRPIRAKGIIQDITGRKEAEEKLRESEEKYRNIVETANEIILITNKEEIVTYANKKIADMLGYSPEEVAGRPIWGFISEEYRPIVKMNLEKRRQGISESYEAKLRRKDGSSIWVLLNAKPLFDREGKYIGAMSMLTDITKRKEAEETLANIETARKKEIHHRIKNNLQVISSLLDLQAENFIKRKSIKNSEFLDALRDSQNRVISMALIHEELYKGDDTDTLNFSEYIKDLADNLFLTYRLGNVDVSLIIDIDKDIFFDMDTSVPLGIIVNELVSNSLKHAFPERNEGEIRIRLHREKSKIEDNKSTSYTLSVSDNGVGIPEYLEIDDVVDTLGMQLVTSLVDQVDGKLELKRDNGTEFIIKFTLTEETNQAYPK